jgi:multiple sugar transport system permease protein
MSEAAVRSPRGKATARSRRDLLAFLLFISPWIVGYLVFTIGPIIATFVLSLTSYDIASPPRLIGLANYREILKDQLFWQSLKVTAYYVAGNVPLVIVFSIILGTLLNQKLYGLSVWRTIYYLPVVTTGVAVSLLWSWIFQPSYGLVNTIIYLVFGVNGPGWFYAKEWAVPAFIIMNLWGVGRMMLIYLAGLQDIPTQLYEAATIDGCGGLRRFRSITLPLMTPVIFFNLVISIIASFQIFVPAFIITQGGPSYASYFYVLNLYINSFEYYRMGYASGLAAILFVFVIALTVLIFRTSGWVHYEKT